MALLRKPTLYNKLAFPAGLAPGFDPTHPAANLTRFSGIASSGAFINLLNGKAGTKTGTPTSKIDGLIGPGITFTSSTDVYSFAGQSTANDHTGTIACFFRPTSLGSTQGLFGTSTADNGVLFFKGSTDVLNIRTNGTNQPATSAALSAGVPYFVAVSWNNLTANFLQVDLRTGKTSTSTITIATQSAPNGTYSVGNGVAFSVPALGVVAPAMFSTAYLSIPKLLQWAKDPWAYWYPRGIDTTTALGFTTGAGNTFNDSVTEAGSASDTDSVVATFAATDTEAATASDADSAIATFAASDTEAGTASDTDAASAIFAAADTEAATASDADGGGYTVAQSESGSATDTEGAAAVYPVSVSEAGTASDADSAVAVFAASDTEAATASDAESTGFSDSVTESGSAADAESATVVFAASASEAGTASDTPAGAAVYPVSETEAASAADVDAGAAVFAVTDTEAATAADSPDAAFGNQTYSVSVTEAASATDSSDTGPSTPATVGGTRDTWRGSYDRKEVDRLYDEWKNAARKVKDKKAKKAVANAVEALEAIQAKGLLSELAPAVELRDEILSLPAKPTAVLIQEIKEQTEILLRLLDEEDEDEIMLMIWAMQ